MQGNSSGPNETANASHDTILLVGQASLPGSVRPDSSSSLLSLEIEFDPQTGTTINLLCHDLSPSAALLVEELFVGKELEISWDPAVSALERRYFAPNRVSLIRAVQAARSQFLRWKQTAAALGTTQPRDAVGTATFAENALSNGGAPRKGSKHQLATLLVTLLAHSKLLDASEDSHRAGRPITAETRRQAVQLYAVLQQILHSVQTEQGLLEPQIEPVSIQDLLQGALRRSSALGHRVPLEQHLPENLAPARGDPLVLEEALVLLFDEVASYALAARAGVEISAERRRTEIQITIAICPREASAPDGLYGESETGGLSDPLEQMWEGGLGTLAARTLVEHQGGRLWMQDSFPQDHPTLCLALPPQNVQEEEQPVSAEWRNDTPIAPKRTTRVTAVWR